MIFSLSLRFFPTNTEILTRFRMLVKCFSRFILTGIMPTKSANRKGREVEGYGKYRKCGKIYRNP